jgi:hypothetical protein
MVIYISGKRQFAATFCVAADWRQPHLLMSDCGAGNIVAISTACMPFILAANAGLPPPPA